MRECYWNMWTPKNKMFDNEHSEQCVGEDLEEHYDPNNSHEMIPNSEECPSYWSYIEACGCNKGETLFKV